MYLVISPTLNEAENIDALIDSVLAFDDLELLVVDDDSSDGTAEDVECRERETSRLHLMRRDENHGFGASYIDGFRWALRKGVSAVFTMDADLSHRPEYLPAMKDLMTGEADVVIGSRYVKGGGVRNWSFPRRFLSRSANIFAKTITGLPVRDCTSGFIGIDADRLRRIDLDSIRCNSYGFLIELKFQLWQAGATFVEIPIIFHDREFGKTKFHSGMILEAVKVCFRLRRERKKQKPVQQS